MILFSKMELNNFWPLVFIAFAFQGLFLATILYTQKKSNRGNLVLALLIFLFSISILDTVVYWTELYMSYPHLLGVSLGFNFVYGPLFYIYLIRISKWKNDFKKLLHFIPFILVICWYSKYYLLGSNEKLEAITTWNNYAINSILTLLGFVSLVLYAMFSFQIIRALEDKYSIKIIRSVHWLGLVFKAYSLFVLLNLAYLLNIIFGQSSRTSDIAITLGYSFFIYLIGYLGLKTSKLLNGIKVDTKKYQSASLPKRFSEEMFARLTAHLELKQSFKNNDIKLGDLAQDLSLSPHHLSQIINQNANQNFSEFINAYRINEAIKLISQFDRMNELAFEVGFNNRTTFNKLFKKATGLTPTEYKKETSKG